jgi:glyoxylase-like metal-dependent hydrolase (beta-lactamase superfamily II)
MADKNQHFVCGFGVTCIDIGLFREGLAACYLLVHNGEAAFIDTGTRNSLPRMLAAMTEAGVDVAQVRWVMPTHVHLDHAGGAGAMMEVFPNATLVVHERGARHLIEPAKLQAGSLAVYGPERYQAAFGELTPVAAERVHIAQDGDRFLLGDRALVTFDTPGHARHHYVVWDEFSRGVFTGDTFGVSYPEFNLGQRRFIFPPTTPVQFDPQAWHSSIDKILRLPLQRVFLTHFGMHETPAELAAQLHEQIDLYVNLAQQLAAETRDAQTDARALSAELGARLMRHSLAELAARHCGQAPALIRQALAGDMELNAQGLVHWLAQLRA